MWKPADVPDTPRKAGADGPFTIVQTVGWGDCDPARIAYTARIPAWTLSALEAWYKAVLGVGWYELNIDQGIGTPFVQLGFDFHAPITPRATLDCTVFVEHVGGASLSHRVEGRQGDTLCFTGISTASFVDATRMKAILIPDAYRVRIERYTARQGRPLAGKPGLITSR